MKIIIEKNKKKKIEHIEDMNPSFMAPERTKKEQAEALKEVGQFIAATKAKRTQKEIQSIKILQLKFLIQDYIEDKKLEATNTFSFFLHKYIDVLEKKDKDFAYDIHIKPTELSQLLNNHRKPNNEIFIKLGAHSNNNLPAILWFQIAEKEKVIDFYKIATAANTIKKEVKNKLEFSI